MQRSHLVAIASSSATVLAGIRIFIRWYTRSPYGWMAVFLDMAMGATLLVLWGIAMTLALRHWQPTRRPLFLIIASLLSLPAFIIALVGWHA